MSTSNRSTERRRHPRAEVLASAVVLAADRYGGTCLVDNLSAGGALLIGGSSPAVGDVVKILLQLPRHRPLVLSGVIVHRVEDAGEHRFAVAFRDVPAAIQDRIQEVVLANLERLNDASTPRVLVVDDAPDIRKALERDLRALGRRAVSAATPAEALEHLGADAGPVDTAIVDLRLQGADGLELLTFLRDVHPALRRVLISGELGAQAFGFALGSGAAHSTLDKPWTRAALTRALGWGGAERRPARGDRSPTAEAAPGGGFAHGGQ